ATDDCPGNTAAYVERMARPAAAHHRRASHSLGEGWHVDEVWRIPRPYTNLRVASKDTTIATAQMASPPAPTKWPISCGMRRTVTALPRLRNVWAKSREEGLVKKRPPLACATCRRVAAS